jgi:hypothetical protein
MNSQDEENLKELFEKFLSAKQAAEAVEDVYKTEQILHEHPAPEPDDMLLANIKAEIALKLLPRRATVVPRIAYKVAAVAAAVLIVTVLSLNLFQNNRASNQLVRASIVPREIWESNNIAADDANLAIFTAEVEQIKDEVSALQSNKSETDVDDAVTELEMNLMEIESDFWKG